MNKAIGTGATIAIIVAAVAAIGFFGWKMTGPRTYSGPPIKMGEHLGGGGGGTGAPPVRHPGGMGGMRQGGPGQ
jgi:hypothetical protein